MILIHPSSLGKLMTKPQSGPADGLSKGAITYCSQLAKEYKYGFKSFVGSKFFDKGQICEEAAIEIYNNVRFTNLVKNTERKSNQWLTGEVDLIIPKKRIIDIKNAWSLATFPATKNEAHDADYEWQGRGYMMLWDIPEFELAWCLVSTPDELIGYEPDELHSVDHIPEELRLTTVLYERNAEKEELIKHKVRLAQYKIMELVEQITMDHAA